MLQNIPIYKVLKKIKYLVASVELTKTFVTVDHILQLILYITMCA